MPLKISRDITLDLIRGYLLCVITIDHLYRFPSFWDYFTGQGKLWVSAAEGFFIISGLLIGLLKSHPKKLIIRSIKLYFLSIAFTLLFTWWGTYHSPLSLKFGITSFSSPNFILDLLTFKYVYGWADFLPFYAIFLIFSPLALRSLSRQKGWLVVLLSFLMWLIRGDNQFLAWQVYYFSGLICGYYFSSFQRFCQKFFPLLIALALTTYLASYYLVLHRQYSILYFDKLAVTPGRFVLSWIWFAASYWFIRRHESQVNKYSLGIFNLLGRNSLFVYSTHAIILFFITSILPPQPHYWLNTLYAGLIIALLAFIVRLKVLTRRIGFKFILSCRY